MYTLIGSRHKRNEKVTASNIFTVLFLFTLHFTPAVYINSGYLSEFMKDSTVGMLYSLASLITMGAIIATRNLVPRFGNYKLFINVLIFEALALAGLMLNISPTITIVSFLAHFICISLFYMHTDIFLESTSDDESTGGTRGFSLLCTSLAFVFGPIIAGLLTDDGTYWRIYALALILLVPAIIYGHNHLKKFKDPKYEKRSFIEEAKDMIHDRDVFFVLICAFILRVFFSLMVIYTPIYLLKTIGFDISLVTMIIGIGLIPFVLLEYPLGRIADKYIGEKEMLSIGFVIMALSTASIVLVPQVPNFWMWALIMFITRVGASMVEVMSEVYLFKKINVQDINAISFFRTLQPIAYVVAPLLGSLTILVFNDIKHVFMMLAIYLLFALRYSLALNDTK